MNPLEIVRASMRELLDERAKKHARGRELIAATEGDAKRALTDAEDTELRSVTARVEAIDAELSTLQARETELVEQEARDKRATELRQRLGGKPVESRGPSTVTSEPGAYAKDARDSNDRPVSYFRDLHAAFRGQATRDVWDRFERNDREWAGVQKRAVTTSAGSVDEMVPPVWMMGEFTELVRADRIIANVIGTSPMPAGTDSWSLPRMATGSSVGAQTSGQNSAFPSADPTTDKVTAVPQTKGGTIDVPIQLLDQSPLPVDEIFFRDLTAAYGVVVDTDVITNSATNYKGLLDLGSDLVATTYTDPSPTVGELYPKVGGTIAGIHRNRKAPAQVCFMTPERWEWMASALDTTGRPLISEFDNPSAVAETMGLRAEGLVGRFRGLPTYLDANIPTNLGSGTNEDRIIVGRPQDSMLWESAPRLEVFRETLAKNGTVVFRLYAYFAQMHNRWTKSWGVISGTGLINTSLF